jgi:hypothetical protein
MSVGPSVADILNDHVTLEIECIDRMYLNVYVPGLQYESGVVAFFRHYHGHDFASSALMELITKAFAAQVHDFVQRETSRRSLSVPGSAKTTSRSGIWPASTETRGRCCRQGAGETVVFRTQKRRNSESGKTYA